MIAGLRHLLGRRVERIRHPGGRALILLYHRIADEPSDPYGLCVSPGRFEEHLLAIRNTGQPIPLGALARGAREGTLRDGAVAVTFDDGYLDNFETALPLLERYDVPATIFVTTGRGGRQREFWWDELERVFLQTEPLPATLELRVRGTLHHWDLKPSDFSTWDENSYRPWRLLSGTFPSARHQAFEEVYRLLNPMAEPERTDAMNALANWAGLSSQSVRLSRRVMTPERVAEVANGGLVAIEAHTVTHPSLPAQPDDVQRWEISSSCATLEAWTGRPVEGFAYPYGAQDSRSVAAVQAAGLAYACSCEYRSVWPGSSPFLLPRLEVENVDGDRFAKLLRWQLL
jgi:peptidoglycan/xylan/chitin deacetylase (PgdA/CDA1 family)